MSTQVKRRRGTTLEHSDFAGASGEITVDTDTWEPVVHDGVTKGGHRTGNNFPNGIVVGGIEINVVGGQLVVNGEVVATDFGRT